MSANYRPEIRDCIKSILEAKNWHFSFIEEIGLFRFGLNLGGNIKNVEYVIDICEDDYLVFAQCPVAADCSDPVQMARMAEFICRANYGLRDGSFEMDFRDGELRYKCYVNCDGMLPSEEVVLASVGRPAAMVKRFGKGILMVLFQGMSPEDAIQVCEGRSPSSGDSSPVPSVAEADREEGASRVAALLQRLQGLKRESEEGESPSDET